MERITGNCIRWTTSQHRIGLTEACAVTTCHHHPTKMLKPTQRLDLSSQRLSNYLFCMCVYVHTCAIYICSHMHNIAIYIYSIYCINIYIFFCCTSYICKLFHKYILTILVFIIFASPLGGRNLSFGARPPVARHRHNGSELNPRACNEDTGGLEDHKEVNHR